MDCEKCELLLAKRLSAWNSYHTQRSINKTKGQSRSGRIRESEEALQQYYKEADLLLRQHETQDHPERGNQTRPEDLDTIARKSRKTS
jgi:predicted Zn-dependent peptidase